MKRYEKKMANAPEVTPMEVPHANKPQRRGQTKQPTKKETVVESSSEEEEQPRKDKTKKVKPSPKKQPEP